MIPASATDKIALDPVRHCRVFVPAAPLSFQRRVRLAAGQSRPGGERVRPSHSLFGEAAKHWPHCLKQIGTSFRRPSSAQGELFGAAQPS